MGVRVHCRTTVNKLPEITATLQGLNGKNVKVGVFNGEHAWLAGIHEYGCDITAKRAKYLTVPIHPDAVGRKAREFSNLFVFTAASGEKFLAKGEGNNLEFYYWLTPSVKIPERSFLRAGHDKYADEVINKAERALSQVIDGRMSEQQFYDMVGRMLATKIKTYARDLDSPPNSNATILAKGSENPLVHTGDMIEHITWKVE